MSQERADLIETLQRHRGFLKHTTRDLTDEQAALRPTVSQLCVGGLIKHVTVTERAWVAFAVGGADGMAEANASAWTSWEDGFRMVEGETLAGLLATYDEVAAETDKLVATLDLDQAQELPKAPWFEPGKTWTVRRTLLHMIPETSQHAGHADILRETIDGAKTMG